MCFKEGLRYMKEIYARDVVRICNGKLLCGNENETLENFINDTREVKEGCVYIGFKGEHNDGSLFYENALENGAKVCILREDSVSIKEVYMIFQSLE